MVIGLLVAFTYLGTGYQFAEYSWWLARTDEGYAVIMDSRTPLAVLRHSLWPLTFWVPYPSELASGKFKNQEKNSVTLTVFNADKKTYIRNMTFLWGPKLIFNLFLWVMLGVINAILAVLFVVYSFLKFVWMLFVVIANVFLAPFGIIL